MNKLLWRYLIYFGIFITLVQLFEYNGTQELFAKCGFRVDFSPLGTYAPLFLSALLIDITYRIGKRQNEIAQRQNEIAEQQTTLQKEQYQLDKFNAYGELHQALYRLEYLSHQVLPQIYKYLTSTWGEFDKQLIEKTIAELEKLESHLSKEEANYLLRHGENHVIKEISAYCALASTILTFALEKIPLPETAKQGSNTPEQLYEAATMRDYDVAYNNVQRAMQKCELPPAIVMHIQPWFKQFVQESKRIFVYDDILQKIREQYNK